MDLPARAFAVLLGVTLAVLGAAGGAWLGWRTAPGLPAEAGALALIGPGFGSVDHVERVDAPFAYADDETGGGALLRSLLGGDDYRAGQVVVVFAAGPEWASLQRVWWTSDWRLQAFYSDDQGQPLTVVGGDRPVFMTVTLERRQPTTVNVLAVLGALVGALTAYAALRLAGRGGGSPRRGAVRFAQAGVVALLPATLLTIGGVLGRLAGDSDELVALWEPFTRIGVRPLSLAGIVCLAVAGVLVVRSGNVDDLGSDGDLWQGAARERLP